MAVSEAQSTLVTFPLSVITAREAVHDNPWISERWRVLGVVAGAGPAEAERSTIYADANETRYLWPGFSLRLYPHEAESYYRNLLGDKPSVYVVCQNDENDELTPVFTTLEYIEASAQREGGDEVFPVDMPPEVYRWLEAYVVENYTPQERKMKRKHADWDKGRGPEMYEPND